MPKPRVQINPAGFSDDQWKELFYCSTLLPGKDDRSKCAPFAASPHKVKEAADSARSKATRILTGDLSDRDANGIPVDSHSELKEWAHILRSAAKILMGYLADPNPPKYACPVCGSSDKLDVVIKVWARLFQDEPDNFETDVDEADEGHDHEWDGTSPMVCHSCAHYGTVADFDTDTAEADDEEDDDDICNACERRSLDCSKNPCRQVVIDRGDLILLTYKARDIGHYSEEETVEGYWESDNQGSMGKRKFQRMEDGPLYLFADEVVSEEEVNA